MQLKLETYGINVKGKELYYSCLKARYQRVLIYNKTHHYSTLSNLTLIKHGIPQGFILGPLLFLLCRNDLPQFVNYKSTPVLFADNTNIFFTHTNTWLKSNYLSLNKKKCIHFKTRNSPSVDMKIGLNNKLMPNALFTKFLGLTIESTLSWRIHIDHPTTKLSTACYISRSMKPRMSHKTLVLNYHSLFHTVMSYGIIFWGNSCHSTQIFGCKRE